MIYYLFQVSGRIYRMLDFFDGRQTCDQVCRIFERKWVLSLTRDCSWRFTGAVSLSKVRGDDPVYL